MNCSFTIPLFLDLVLVTSYSVSYFLLIGTLFVKLTFCYIVEFVVANIKAIEWSSLPFKSLTISNK